ncbi:MAG: hypothetical protein QXM06_06535 [Archaeoglobaceae archaeon]
MEILPIAFDSMGVRSMATVIKTDLRITIDPSVSLAPYRYGLPPHRIEIERMNEKWVEIKRSVAESQIAIITHYHYDHYNPEEVEIFEGKKLLIKHPRENINRSQLNRAAYFLEKLKNLKAEVDYCDGKSYEIGNTYIELSQPVFHGVNNKLGYVVEVFIEHKNKSFVFSSDVEGPIHEEQVAFIIEKNPEIVLIDGPMTYMLGYRYSARSLESSFKNIRNIIERTDVKCVILDHHLLRDLNWREKIQSLFDFSTQYDVKIMSAAEFAGVKEDLLEARRKELHGKI